MTERSNKKIKDIEKKKKDLEEKCRLCFDKEGLYDASPFLSTIKKHFDVEVNVDNQSFHLNFHFNHFVAFTHLFG